jgi:hypothetical protein
MKLLYSRNIAFLAIAVVFIHTTRAQQQDPSLFDLNEANEQDTYNMIEQMQDLSPKDQQRDDEINEIERMDRHILEEQLHINQEQQLEDEEEEEDDDEDIPLDFKNHDETEFFDHPPMNHDNHLNHMQQDDTHDQDDEYDEYEEEDEEIEILGKNIVPIPPESKVEAPIPWHRPNHYGNVDSSSFYQDENATRVVQKSRFKVWHSVTFLVVFVLIYRWISKVKQ